MHVWRAGMAMLLIYVFSCRFIDIDIFWDTSKICNANNPLLLKSIQLECLAIIPLTHNNYEIMNICKIY